MESSRQPSAPARTSVQVSRRLKRSRDFATATLLLGFATLTLGIVGTVLGFYQGVGPIPPAPLFWTAVACGALTLLLCLHGVVKHMEEGRSESLSSSLIGAAMALAVLAWWGYVIFGIAPKMHREAVQMQEGTHLNQIGFLYIRSDSAGVHPTELIGQFKDPAAFRELFGGALNPQQGQADAVTVISPEDRVLLDAPITEAKAGAYRFGGFWFVVNDPQSFQISNPIAAFSRRWSTKQAGRAVLTSDGAVNWMSEEEFAGRLMKENLQRAKLRWPAIEPAD